MIYKIKEDLLLGVATASTQIEGGKIDNNWYDWYLKGHIKDNSNPEIANEHYKRFKEDILLMKEMGIKTYRFSIEWCKIEPSYHKFDESVMNHYLEEIKILKEADIIPLLTLHHFSNPMWFEKMGGFLCDNASDIFLEFATYVVRKVAPFVNEYITINEPNVFVVNGYFFGVWYPGIKSLNCVKKAYCNITLTHIKCYNMIHEIRSKQGYKDTLVGFANHITIFKPVNQFNLIQKIICKIMDKAFQASITDSMMIGSHHFPVKNHKQIKKGHYYDFIGINYYTKQNVSSFKDFTPLKGMQINDLNWEIYPKGLIEVAKRLYNKYQAPIYITENGTCDNNDTFRSRYLNDQLKLISESDLPFVRYYHWTFIDNWEWVEGESARFGLIHLDYRTQVRTIKNSGMFYTSIIKNQGVTEEDYNKYVNDSKYQIK